MNISLNPELERLIEQKVKSGMYNSASEVIRAGLRLLQEQEDLRDLRFTEFRHEIQRGLDDIEQGRIVDGEEVFKELVNRNQKLQKNKKIKKVSQLKFSHLARQDLQNIHDYIADDNIDAAAKFIEKLHYRCLCLTKAPKTGRIRNEFSIGARSIIEGNYLIVYHPLSNGVIIARVLHSKRNISKILRSAQKP